MKLTGFEKREKQRFMELHPKWLSRPIKRRVTGGEISKSQQEFAKELETEYGVPFSVIHHPLYGRHWARTGFLFADPDWGNLASFGENADAGEKIIKAYLELKVKREELYYWVGFLATGTLLAATGLTGKDFLSGLKWLYRQEKIHAQVNRQGKAVYVALNHPRQTELEYQRKLS